MLFNFELRPLADVAPWGGEDRPVMHWFGLTDGYYWLEVGDHKLFAYKDDAIQKLAAPQYVDYQVIRLYEDILSILPHVLEPLPSEFRDLVIGEGALWLEAAADHYAEGVPGVIVSHGVPFIRKLYESARLELEVDEANFNVVSKATDWRYRRVLDTMYLGPGPRIAIWSDEQSVHLGWDNRGIARNGTPIWSAVEGVFSLRRDEFIAEIQSFHDRLIDQMGHRIQAVLDGALSPEIDIDYEGLQVEHIQRSMALQIALQKQIVPTDWEEARIAISALVDMADREAKANTTGGWG